MHRMPAKKEEITYLLTEYCTLRHCQTLEVQKKVCLCVLCLVSAASCKQIQDNLRGFEKLRNNGHVFLFFNKKNSY